MTERVELRVAANHRAFAGHFPGRPIVPGALLIDLAVLAIEHATGRQVDAIAQAKFLSPSTPGETLSVLFDANENSVRFEIEASNPDADLGRKLATGRLSLHTNPARTFP